MTKKQLPFRWISFAASDTGSVRKVNEDSFLDMPELGLWAVADGMGGHEAGDLASRLVVQQLAAISPARFLGQTVKQIRRVLTRTNQECVAQAAARGGGIIGTTAVVLYVRGQHCAVVWVGDSRVYRLRHGRLQQLTKDHSQVEALIAEGLIDRIDAENHPAGNIITRAIGGSSDLVVDTRVDQVLDKDVYLLCSDGLTKELSSEEIAQILVDTLTGNAAEVLLARALDRGARDNLTVVVTKMEALSDAK
jgi:protein phosphatase